MAAPAVPPFVLFPSVDIGDRVSWLPDNLSVDILSDGSTAYGFASRSVLCLVRVRVSCFFKSCVTVSTAELICSLVLCATYTSVGCTVGSWWW